MPEGYRGAPYLVKDQERSDQMRLLPALRICLPAQSHSNHSAWAKRRSRGRQRREGAEGI